MIRLISFLVFFVGAAFAFGAFYLARGSNQAAPQTVAAPAPVITPEPEPEIPETPVVEKFYYLRDIDFDQGNITVVYTGAGPNGANLIVADHPTLQAAKEQAFANTHAGSEQETNRFEFTPMSVKPDSAAALIYRNDNLIAAVTCTPSDCGDFTDDPNADHAGLLSMATPHQLINDTFNDHATYLATILAISEDPNFMLLDKRTTANFPADAIAPALTISLPTAVIQSIETFDSAAFETRIRDAITAQLPDGASITNVTTNGLRPAYLADKDNNDFVTAGGQPIAFPDARFLPVSVNITGADYLSDAAYDAITEATLLEFNVDSSFEDFVTSRLQTTCVDCYFLKVDGPFFQSTRPTAQTIEAYTLEYYDLREGP